MAFSHSPSFFSVANHDDMVEGLSSDMSVVVPQPDMSPQRVVPNSEDDTTINPALLLIQHEDLDAASPIQRI